MSTSQNSGLPTYSNPPVIETVLGFQFERLPRFTNAHLGVLWQMLGTASWPHASDAAIIAPQIERFDDAPSWAGARIELSSDPASRLQLQNSDRTQMIQIQNGRLHLNWLGLSGQQYPRFEKLREEFTQVLDVLHKFVDLHKIGDIRPNQWEVTYVNHIPKGELWKSPADWTFFLPMGKADLPGDVACLENIKSEWHFVLPKNAGRLYVNWSHVLDEPADGQQREVVRLTLTARGPVGGEPGQVMAGIDLGRVAIVRSFAALMSNVANEQWGLRDGDD